MSKRTSRVAGIAAALPTAAMQPVYIRGALHAGRSAVAHQAVVLEVARPDRPMGPMTYPHLTSSSGAVSFKIRAAGTWKWELVFRGASGLAATHSRVLTIKVP